MIKIPRKKKKKIPKGLYCYKGIKFDEKTGIYHIKPCQFYQSQHPEFPDDKILGWCRLLKCDVEDQTKSCGINYGFK